MSFYGQQASKRPANTNFLQDTLNVVTAPGDTAGNIVSDLASGRGIDGSTFSPMVPGGDNRRVKAGKIGESLGIENKVLAGGAGLATQIFLDPTTYLGIGILSKGGKASALADAAFLSKANLIDNALHTRSELGRVIGKEKIRSMPTNFLKSTIQGQAQQGQRNLLQFAGQSILPKSVDEAVFGYLTQGKKAMLGERTFTGIKSFDDGVEKFSNILRDTFISKQRIRPKGMPEEEFSVMERNAVVAFNKKSAAKKAATKYELDLLKNLEDIAKSISKNENKKKSDVLADLRNELDEAFTVAVEKSSKEKNKVIPLVRPELTGIRDQMVKILDDSTAIRKEYDKQVVDGFYLPLVLKEALLGNYRAKTAPKIGKSKLFNTKSGSDLQSNWRMVEGPEGSAAVNFDTGVAFFKSAPGKRVQLKQTDLNKLERGGTARRAAPREINEAMGKEFFFEDTSILTALALQNAGEVEAMALAIEEFKHVLAKNYQEIALGIPKEANPLKSIVDEIPDDIPRDEEVERFLDAFARNETSPFKLAEDQKQLYSTLQAYNVNNKNALIPKVDIERLMNLQDELGFTFAPIEVPTGASKSRPEVKATFQLPGNKSRTQNNILRDQFEDAIDDGKEVIADFYSGAGTMVAIMPDLAKRGAKEFHFNFFDQEKFRIQSAIFEGKADEVKQAIDTSYTKIVELVEANLLKSKNKDVRRIMKEFKAEQPDGVRFGSTQFKQWYEAKGYPKPIVNGEFYEAWQKPIQKAMDTTRENFGKKVRFDEDYNPYFEGAVTEIQEATDVAVFTRIVMGDKSQRFIGKDGFFPKENSVFSFKELIDRDAAAYAKTQELGAQVTIHSEDGKDLIHRLIPEFKERGLSDKVVAYADPPYKRTTGTYLAQQRGKLPEQAIESLGEYTSGPGVREIFRPILQEVENGMDAVFTNDVDPDYIEAIIGGSARFDPEVYTYKEATTPTSLISTRSVKGFKDQYKPKNVKEFIAGNVDTTSQTSRENLRKALKERIETSGFEGGIRDFVDAAKGRTKAAPLQYERVINKRLSDFTNEYKSGDTYEDFMGKARNVMRSELMRDNNRNANMMIDDFEYYQKYTDQTQDINASGNINFKPNTRRRMHRNEIFGNITRAEGRAIAEQWKTAKKIESELNLKIQELQSLEAAAKNGRKNLPKAERQLFKNQTADVRKEITGLKRKLGKASNFKNFKAVKENPKFESFLDYFKTEKAALRKFYDGNLKGMRGDAFKNNSQTNVDVFKEQFEGNQEAMELIKNYETRTETLEYFEGEFDDYIKSIVNIETARRIRPKKAKKVKESELDQFVLRNTEAPEQTTDNILTLDELFEKKIGDAGFSGNSKQFYQIISGKNKHSKIPNDWIASKVPELEGYVGPPEYIEFIDRVQESFTNINAVQEWLIGYDKVQSYWKKLATLSNVAYHSRNALSAYMMNWYGGLGTLDSLPDYKFASEVVFAIKSGKPLAGKQKELWEEFQSQGLDAQLFMGVDDIGRGLQNNIPQNAFDKTLGNQNPLFRAGTAVGHTVEDFFRFTAFTNQKRQGYSTFQASEFVKKLHYDYSELTEIERGVFRRVLPFYSWTRKNLPRSLQILTQNPERFARIDKVAGAVSEMFGSEEIDEEMLPDYVREGIPVFIGKDKQGNSTYFRMKGVVPALDVGAIANPTKEFAGQLSPLIKNPIELGTNYDLFKGRNIRDYEGQTVTRFGGALELSPEANKLLQNIRPINELEKITTGRTQNDFTGGQQALSAVAGSVSTVNKNQAIKSNMFRKQQEVNAMNRSLKQRKEQGKSTKVLERRIEVEKKNISNMRKSLPKSER